MPSGACRNVGSREGYWRETAGHWDEWTLHPSRTCNDTILPFVRVRTGCEADEGNQQELGASALRCVDMEHSLPTQALRKSFAVAGANRQMSKITKMTKNL